MTPASAALYRSERRTLRALREAAHGCRGCELFHRAQHVVFGKGPASASLMIVGKVPGDREDEVGLPFVGPAGKLLDECLAAAGIDRSEAYPTNAVKHFKWEPRGKRRLHARPSAREISACRPWLEAEIEAVRPQAIICLGAVAAQTLLGSGLRITRQRGQLVASLWAKRMIATWHPSAILRSPEEEERRQMRAEFIDDLRLAANVDAKHAY